MVVVFFERHEHAAVFVGRHHRIEVDGEFTDVVFHVFLGKQHFVDRHEFGFREHHRRFCGA